MMRDRPQQVVEALLRSHDANVADEVAPPALVLGDRRNRLELGEVGPAAHDEHVLGPLLPASSAIAR